MKKFLKLIKKNKILSLVLLILIIILILFLVIFLGKKKTPESGYSSNMEKIDSPYPKWSKELNIISQTQLIEIPKNDKILTVTGFNSTVVSVLIEEVYNSFQEINALEDFYLQLSNKDIITYAFDTGILSISSAKGVPLDYEINSQEDIKQFLSRYLDIKEFKFEDETITKGVTKYSGKYLIKETEIGSSFLNGNSFLIEVNKDAKIIKASVLLINESYVKEYQYLPLVDLKELITQSSYPKKIGEVIIEDRYYDTPSPYDFTEYILKSVSLVYIFNDIESRHIVPTYVLDGEAEIKDSYKEKHWSKVRIFICAVDPSYLYTKKDILQEESKEEEGAPFVR
ncbi:hypothetical protein GX618_02265 [Candidatus Dojkabacteria bacterium]|uniref:Uncharacterized protein n=1 Tax=Candidatus Dojkabacteria bacterium TaxID=2099670 RepID=A0A847ETC9_9BACT|nr:hypothetical protein [Candidatus Dojkabacteria bacterium]